MSRLDNENPEVYEVKRTGPRSFFDVVDVLSNIESPYPDDFDFCDDAGPGGEYERDAVDADEVFEHLRHLNDPEHPLTLEALNVISPSLIKVDDRACSCDVSFTPTIPHCSMATLIGLSIRVKLIRSLPERFKVTVNVTPGTHTSEFAINKQLNDKERVAAALENMHLLKVVNKCIAHTDPIFAGEEAEKDDEPVDEDLREETRQALEALGVPHAQV